jgi:signal transduction histidine kinase
VAAGRLVHRIRRVGAQTRSIAAGNFQPVTVPGPDDELADLARAVNDMARRLDEYQARLKEGERMRVIGQFAGGLAHQIRNAATGARLAVEVFERESPPTDPEPLRVARQQLARIETGVKQFLDLGRGPDGAKTNLDLRTILADAIASRAPACQHAGTSLTWSPPPEPILVRGNAEQLGHLFANLIGNATEAAGPGGSVELAARPSPANVEIDVTDTGPGPPAELATRLFDPFVTGKPEGIGLGLAVAKQAADAHGGTLSWHRAGDRTVFRVLLPRE